jgi:hypothetical protein
MMVMCENLLLGEKSVNNFLVLAITIWGRTVV